MPRREATHIRRELTDAQRASVAEARSLIQGEAAEIRRKGKEYKRERAATQATLKEAAGLLNDERVRPGLSLSDIQQRTGIDPPNRSRLENDADANPTMATLAAIIRFQQERSAITCFRDKCSTKPSVKLLQTRTPGE